MIHIGKYFYYLFHGGLKILAYPHQAKKYIKNKDDYPLEERYEFVRVRASDVLTNVMGLRFNVKGLDKLDPSLTYLFAPNHQGMLDPVCLIHLLSKPTIFVSKKEIRKFPIVGNIDYIIDAYFFDRESPRAALEMVKVCHEHLINKRNVVIFPEGTRSKDEEVSIHQYKSGAFKCAYKSGAIIVPVVFDKAYLPLSSKRKNPEKVIDITFLEPILPDEYENLTTAELSEKIENLAKKELKSLRKPKKT